MTTPASDRSPFPTDDQHADVPSALSRIAWPQVGVLSAIGLAVLGPIVIALLLAM